MKFCSAVFFSLTLFCAAANAANIEQMENGDAKVYVSANEVCVRDDQIYVLVNQNWQVTSAIHSDAQGLFFVDHKGGWTCGRCGRYNTSNLWSCDFCGAPRS